MQLCERQLAFNAESQNRPDKEIICCVFLLNLNECNQSSIIILTKNFDFLLQHFLTWDFIKGYIEILL